MPSLALALINCTARFLIQSGQISFGFFLKKMTFEKNPCGVPALRMYGVCSERRIRRTPESDEGELVSKNKEKMTKGTSSKQTVVVQAAFGEMWKMCSEARSSSFGYQLTISFV